MNLNNLLQQASTQQGSDLFFLPGAPVSIRICDELRPIQPDRLTPDDAAALIRDIYCLCNRDMGALKDTGDDDFSFSLPGVGRFRCNAYRQRNSYAAVLRVVSFNLPDPKRIHIPDEVLSLVKMRKGLVLVTGPAGSGKSTTLACIIDQINRTRSCHIVTIEDPIEFIHPHRLSIISQRELGQDTRSYACALRAALRQSPDVIFVGEMRDYETIQTVMTAAETGQLVLSTLHTIGAGKTIDRIIDVFPASQQQQVRTQLSMTLEAVVSQQLIPAVSGGLIPAFEIMITNSAVRNLIRENKTYQIDNVLYSGAAQGMRTIDGDLLRLYQEGAITGDIALQYATDPDSLSKKLGTVR
jgi:pilus retraction protein PilT